MNENYLNKNILVFIIFLIEFNVCVRIAMRTDISSASDYHVIMKLSSFKNLYIWNNYRFKKHCKDNTEFPDALHYAIISFC